MRLLQKYKEICAVRHYDRQFLFMRLITIAFASFILMQLSTLKSSNTPPREEPREKVSCKVLLDALAATGDKQLLHNMQHSLLGDLRHNSPPYQSGMITGTKGVAVPLFYKLSAENIHQVFTHKFDRLRMNTFGAKTIAISLDGQEPTIYFFPTGIGKRGFNVLHRDALSNALEEEIIRSLLPFDNSSISAPQKTKVLIDSLYHSIEAMTALLAPDTLIDMVKKRGHNQDPLFKRASEPHDTPRSRLSIASHPTEWKMGNHDVRH